eukprot:CAMPEP_0194775594 /NCGR_PEP_ID=MMETSP0323_2-20130528/60804_1 /TAXON_ID=2866 ORGANISM="Crypthecodinium cohnii, Strain Seligo" /NCGR_SAMPLE_ID=MMETSP0323_2 /ASSEMBLY_ACC=CAM_ASM_000346 /LENGTH=172 /DNA_ID=CAMNT_0039711649 /DNA_START=91 /DNA_END=611 /DNA_ORIENTATION=+
MPMQAGHVQQGEEARKEQAPEEHGQWSIRPSSGLSDAEHFNHDFSRLLATCLGGQTSRKFNSMVTQPPNPMRVLIIGEYMYRCHLEDQSETPLDSTGDALPSSFVAALGAGTAGAGAEPLPELPERGPWLGFGGCQNRGRGKQDALGDDRGGFGGGAEPSADLVCRGEVIIV